MFSNAKLIIQRPANSLLKLSKKHIFKNELLDLEKYCTANLVCGLQSDRHLCSNTKSTTEPGLHAPDEREQFVAPEPEYDWDYLCKPEKRETIAENIANRKGVGNIDKLNDLWKLYSKSQDSEKQDDFQSIKKQLFAEADNIPNRTHPNVPLGEETNAKQLDLIGSKQEFDFKPKSVVELGENIGALRTKDLGVISGHKSYFFLRDFARLQQALISYTLDELQKQDFVQISVPELIHSGVIEGCGFKTSGERTQVYKLAGDRFKNICLAGTGEMSLAGYFMNKVHPVSSLPKKVTTVSRCFRAETSEVEEEKGIYRVHQFTKVEMFALSANETGLESEELMEQFVTIQKKLFSDLGLHFRVLDMPSYELGAPAYRKYDMETWMPAKEFWGEISSTSNCTDFQSRRLNMKYLKEDGSTRHVHTVNGTACAVPRMIMAITENNQNEDGAIRIPKVLQPYLDNRTLLEKPKDLPKMQWIKLSKLQKRR